MEDNIRYFPGIIQTRAMGAEDLPEDDDNLYWLRILASNAEVDKTSFYYGSGDNPQEF